ncbi:DUF1467 family protein [Hyphobacterium sp.]|uniref:DUF1467 family protein n=1 Tax=Hyphobacterium sp. TaxID=2004662 RepID=UPI003BA90091
MPKFLGFLPPVAVAILWILQFFIPGEGMNVFSGMVVFLITWWITLFTVLPIGIQGQAESGEMVQGTESGAPVSINLKQKAWTTTIVASIIWLVLFVLLEFQLVTLNDIPFLPGENSWDA